MVAVWPGLYLAKRNLPDTLPDMLNHSLKEIANFLTMLVMKSGFTKNNTGKPVGVLCLNAMVILLEIRSKTGKYDQVKRKITYFAQKLDN